MSKKEEKLTKMDVSDLKSVDGGNYGIHGTQADGFWLTGWQADGRPFSGWFADIVDAVNYAKSYLDDGTGSQTDQTQQWPCEWPGWHYWDQNQ